MNSNTRPEQIIDKNGKQTTVHKKVDDGTNNSAKRVSGIGKTPVAFVPSRQLPVMTGGDIDPNDGVVSIRVSSDEQVNLDAITAAGIGSAMQGLYGSRTFGDSPETSRVVNDKVDIEALDNGDFRVNLSDAPSFTIDAVDFSKFSAAVTESGDKHRDIDTWHSAIGYVNVVKSPVGSDYEENYWIKLGDNALLNMYIFESGLSNKEFGNDDRDDIAFYREEDDSDYGHLQVSLGDDIDLSELDSSELDEIQERGEAALQSIHPELHLNMDDPENVTMLFGSKFAFDNDGGFHTAVALADAEAEFAEISDAAWDTFRNLTSSHG